ncbi:MAG: EscJ/YscJ/HrcJ family type III secretion inner membrane ring protein [Chlamydiae bacterium]|nr:EscJ/YscJ/HrcJ family type III secretion inner membrane ring protein [Chlamydiota bacterium]
MTKHILKLFFVLSLFLLASCESNRSIVNNVDEREANEIVVYLASKGIEAQKVTAPSTGIGGTAPTNQFSIAVAENRAVDAMSLLNKVGLPRRQGTTLLDLFAKSGLMSSTLEETVRYQAGLAEELRNTIRKIDGVIDADVQISFPPATAGGATPAPGTVQPKITAAVYVKHQGILEDPNSHVEMKIKRLMAGSVNGLSYDDVAVISDRSRFADITLTAEGEPIGPKSIQTHVSIWGLVLTQSSIGRFRFIFFAFTILILALLSLVGWMVYKFYPQINLPFLKRKSSETPPLI